MSGFYRIYVDAVINHMTGSGAYGTGTAGSNYDARSLSFPAAGFGPNDFNCCHCSVCGSSDCNIGNYNNPNEVCNKTSPPFLLSALICHKMAFHLFFYEKTKSLCICLIDINVPAV